MTHLCAGIASVDFRVEQAIEGHGHGAGGHHGHHDAGQFDPHALAREAFVAPGQQRSGQGERQGEDGMLELDHFERQAKASQEAGQEQIPL